MKHVTPPAASRHCVHNEENAASRQLHVGEYADRRSASQDRKVNHCVHKGALLVPALSQVSPVHSLKLFFGKFVLILFSHVCLVLPSRLLPLAFPTKFLHEFVISLTRVTCLADMALCSI
jgi:hypothetical protein